MPAAAHLEANTSHGVASSEASRASARRPPGRVHWIDWLRIAANAGVFVLAVPAPAAAEPAPTLATIEIRNARSR